MATFSDRTGKPWAVNLGVGTLLRVQERVPGPEGKTGPRHGFDLMSIVDKDAKGLDALATDLALLASVIYAICQPEIDAEGLSIDDFFDRLDGAACEAATLAIMDAIADFSTGSKKMVLKRTIREARTAMEKADAEVEKALNDPTLSATIQGEIAKRFGATSGDAPESSA